MNNRESGLKERLYRGIMNGTYDFVFNSARVVSNDAREGDVKDRTCLLASKPKYLKIDRAAEVGEVYRSLREEDFDPVLCADRVKSLLGFINHDYLGLINLRFLWPIGVQGELPEGEELKSFEDENEVVVMPILKSNVYSIDGEAIYKASGETDYCRFKFEEAGCFVNLKEGFDFGRRDYNVLMGESLNVKRYPVWFNPRGEKIERVARVPLEVLTDMLEPVTTDRIGRGTNEVMRALDEILYEADLGGEEEHEEYFVGEARKDGLRCTCYNVIDERIVAEALVKMWLLSDLNKFDLGGDDVFSWRPFKSHARSSEVSHQFMRRFKKRQRKLVEHYISENWGSMFG